MSLKQYTSSKRFKVDLPEESVTGFAAALRFRTAGRRYLRSLRTLSPLQGCELELFSPGAGCDSTCKSSG